MAWIIQTDTAPKLVPMCPETTGQTHKGRSTSGENFWQVEGEETLGKKNQSKRERAGGIMSRASPSLSVLHTAVVSWKLRNSFCSGLLLFSDEPCVNSVNTAL